MSLPRYMDGILSGVRVLDLTRGDLIQYAFLSDDKVSIGWRIRYYSLKKTPL